MLVLSSAGDGCRSLLRSLLIARWLLFGSLWCVLHNRAVVRRRKEGRVGAGGKCGGGDGNIVGRWTPGHYL